MRCLSLVVLSVVVAMAGCADKGAAVTEGTQASALLEKAADVLAEMLREAEPPAGAAGESGGEVLENAAAGRAVERDRPLTANVTEPVAAQAPAR
jgi:hypothetical protein